MDIKERFYKWMTGKTKYQRAKKEWFKQRIYKYNIRETSSYDYKMMYYKKDDNRYYKGSLDKMSQFMGHLWKMPASECFFSARYNSMVKESLCNFDYETVVDYERDMFNELSPQQKREQHLKDLLGK